MSRVGRGTRVYWHGVFPDFSMKGTVQQVGKIRHEVLWDGDSAPSLEWRGVVKPVKSHGSCPCGRCKGECDA